MNRLPVFLLFLLASTVSSQAILWISNSPYLDLANSPLLTGNGGSFTAGANNFYVETFEDGSLNDLPGVTFSTGQFLNNHFTDSVDGDDGLIDGIGAFPNYSWMVNTTTIDFTFNNAIIGAFPTHFGVVVTGANSTDREYVLDAYDTAGIFIGTSPITIVSNPSIDGSGGFLNGDTQEDRFLGVEELSGLSRVTLRTLNDTQLELDHVQFGVIPEPAYFALPTLALLYVLFLRRRK